MLRTDDVGQMPQRDIRVAGVFQRIEHDPQLRRFPSVSRKTAEQRRRRVEILQPCTDEIAGGWKKRYGIHSP